jgi:hypothetical protein
MRSEKPAGAGDEDTDVGETPISVHGESAAIVLECHTAALLDAIAWRTGAVT